MNRSSRLRISCFFAAALLFFLSGSLSAWETNLLPLIQSVPETADGVFLLRPDAVRKCPALQKHFRNYVEKTAELPEVCLIVLMDRKTLLLLPETKEQAEIFDRLREGKPYLTSWNRSFLPEMEFDVTLPGAEEPVSIGRLQTGVLAVAEESVMKKMLSQKKNTIPALLRSEELLFSKDVLIACVFRTGKNHHGMVPALPDAVKLVSCVRYEPFLPYPVSGELSFDGSDAAGAKRIYDGVKTYVSEVYRNAAQQGQVRPELQQAFQVYSFGMRTRVIFQLTESLSRDFFDLLHQSVSTELKTQIISVK